MSIFGICFILYKVNTYSEKLFPSDDCASIWSWLLRSKIMTSRETQE